MDRGDEGDQVHSCSEKELQVLVKIAWELKRKEKKMRLDSISCGNERIQKKQFEEGGGKV